MNNEQQSPAPQMVWSDTSISNCPNCGKQAVVGIMSLCATCTCGHYYVDINEGRGWYASRQAYEAGEPLVTMRNEQQSAASESQPEPIRCSQQNGQSVSDGVGHEGCCAERKALAVTAEIERDYHLPDRVRAVMSAVHAHDHIRNDKYLPFLDRMNACELLRDGITNAIDGRSTGREFRTLRHSWLAKNDPQHFPYVPEDDRRCQDCGAINPPEFSYCRDHRPALAAPCECERDNVLAQQLRDACDKLKSLCLRWNKMASHFTAGSEFVDDPERVGKALESRFRLQRGIHEAVQAKLCDEVKQLQSAVELHKGAAEELRAQLAAKDALLVEARNSLSGNRNG